LSRKISIAFVMPSLRVGGAEKRTLALLSHLDRKAFAPSLIVQHGDGPLWQDLPPDVPFIDLDTARMRFVVPAMRAALRKTQPDIVFALIEHTCIAVAMAARAENLSAPLVFSIRSNISKSLGSMSVPMRLVYRAAFKHYFPDAAAIVAVSRGAGDEFARLTPEVRERIAVLPSPVVPPELAEQSSVAPDHIWTRSEVPYILACGRLVSEKGFGTLIRAFGRVRERRNVRLLILGEGPQRKSLEALVKQLHLRGSVAMPGRVSTPYRFMGAAAAFVLSSRWEGMPGVLIEAMACGAPVVAADCKFGPGELIDHERNGLLAKPDDVTSLEEQIERVLGDPAFAARLGAAGRASMVRYSEAAACAAHEEVFHSLLAKPQARGAAP
jgi:glycosyltransferase involved in cell wall biosynthesis